VLTLPPLRERGDDIRLLAEHCVARFACAHRRATRAISREALALMAAYPWPGNVRQLNNVLERAVLLADGPVLLPAHLPAEIRTPMHSGASVVVSSHGFSSQTLLGSTAPVAGAGPAEGLLPLGELERRHITHALALTGGHLARAAELLGIHRNTLRRKLQEYGLSEASVEAGRSLVAVDVEVVMPPITEIQREWAGVGSSFTDIATISPESHRGPSLAMACNAA
jgi:DNA-binding NtrC family response regulator